MIKPRHPKSRIALVDVIGELKDYGVEVDVYDPWVDASEAEHEYDIRTITEPHEGVYDGLIVAVAHHQFREQGINAIRALGRNTHVLYDLKGVWCTDESDLRL